MICIFSNCLSVNNKSLRYNSLTALFPFSNFRLLLFQIGSVELFGIEALGLLVASGSGVTGSLVGSLPAVVASVASRQVESLTCLLGPRSVPVLTDSIATLSDSWRAFESFLNFQGLAATFDELDIATWACILNLHHSVVKLGPVVGPDTVCRTGGGSVDESG